MSGIDPHLQMFTFSVKASRNSNCLCSEGKGEDNPPKICLLFSVLTVRLGLGAFGDGPDIHSEWCSLRGRVVLGMKWQEAETEEKSSQKAGSAPALTQLLGPGALHLAGLPLGPRQGRKHVQTTAYAGKLPLGNSIPRPS